ncbi:hypothetical protein [Parachryseolinea silvisoli]|uniref:hypothetical protein n=1 Tax=Parachryseolinea silvisoli TaxID=2873601 RepID=UPI002265EED0|nr:hypothetical protein [Parachryseolinea silvisoli]MCD9015205.1 hypothetical protein [Parachryseolinea silvisoli]
MSSFEIYRRIVSGDLRPNLKIYNARKGLNQLEASFFSKPVKVGDRNEVIKEVEDFLKTSPRYKEGDTVKIRIDNKNRKITVEVSNAPGEEDLINIDICPPWDFRGELFSRIIEDVHLRFKNTIKEKLRNSDNSDDLEFFANHSISILKQIAIDAHLFEKRLSASNTKDSRSSRYVLMVLKKHLLYAIIEIEISLKALIKIPLQTEFELEDELYEFSASKMEERVKKNIKEMDTKYIQRFYGELGIKATEEAKMTFFRNKVVDMENYIQTAEQVYPFNIHHRDLLLNEYGRLLSKEFISKIFSVLTGTTEDLPFLIQERTRLLEDKNSIECRALSTTDFFHRIELRINAIKELTTTVTADPDQLLKDIISFCINLQGRKGRNYKENDLNTDLADLLRAKGYNISDQTLHGRSGGGNNSSIPGELDIAIRDPNNNGIIMSIVECFIIDSCGPENKIIEEHIHKLLNRYDTAGNRHNFAVIFAKAKDFHGLWRNYQEYINHQVFKSRLDTTELNINDLTYEYAKVCVTDLQRRDSQRRLFHIFINMYNS